MLRFLVLDSFSQARIMTEDVSKFSPQVGECCQKYLVEFLTNFDTEVKSDGVVSGYYYEAAREIVDERKKTLYLDYTHLDQIDPSAVSFSLGDLKACIRYKFFFLREYLDNAVPQFLRKIGQTDETMLKYVNSQKQFSLSIFNFPTRTPLRDLTMDLFGQLNEITGTVTRTTETKPELLIGVFECSMISSFT